MQIGSHKELKIAILAFRKHAQFASLLKFKEYLEPIFVHKTKIAQIAYHHFFSQKRGR